MHKIRFALPLLVIALGVNAVLAQSVTVIRGATLIDPARDVLVQDGVIVIEGNRIRQVSSGAPEMPEGAVVIDAGGKFIVPGLADMHNHVQSEALSLRQNLAANLARLLAAGVTTVFNPSISETEFRALKTVADEVGAPYPHFFGTGPIVTVQGDFFGAQVGGLTPSTEAEARMVVGTRIAMEVTAEHGIGVSEKRTRRAF